MRQILQLWLQLGKIFHFYRWYQITILLVGGIVLSGLELLGVAAILPLMTILLNPKSVFDSESLAYIYEYLGFSTTQNFALFFAGIIITAFTVKILVHIIYWLYQSYLLAYWQEKIQMGLFKRLLGTSYEKILGLNSSETVSYIAHHMFFVMQSFIYPSITLLHAGVTASLLCFYILYLNPAVFLSVMGAIMLFFGSFIYWQRRKLYKIGKDRTISSQRLTERVQQAISGFKETKIYHAENYAVADFNHNCKKFSISLARISFIQNLPPVIIEYIVVLVVSMTFMILVFFSGNLSDSANEIVIIAVVGLRLVPLFNKLVWSLGSMESHKEFVLRLFEIHQKLAQPNPDALAKGDSSAAYSDRGTLIFNDNITLNNVSFEYQNADYSSIKNLSLLVKKGEFIGIVGPSGSGKTTLINILLGLLENYQGSYQIDGQVIGKNNLEELQRMISFVDQKPFIVNGNFIDNVAYGVTSEQVDMERVKQSVKQASLSAHVQSCPDGLLSYIGEHGVRLSGGQIQRLAFARALYHHSEILILDEASSALDVATEKSLIQILETLHGKLTMISISHRLSTLKNCDRIIFMDDGRIVDEGSFASLYRSNKIFKSYIDDSNIITD